MTYRLRTLDDPVDEGDLYCYKCKTHLICEGNGNTEQEWLWTCGRCNYCVVRIGKE